MTTIKIGRTYAAKTDTAREHDESADRWALVFNEDGKCIGSAERITAAYGRKQWVTDVDECGGWVAADTISELRRKVQAEADERAAWAEEA